MSHRVAQADLAACRAALRNGSRTFLAASILLPRAVHEPACALYAFCRLADDAVDGAGSAVDDGSVGSPGDCPADASGHGTTDRRADGATALHAASHAVQTLRHRLTLAYRGTPLPTPADRALAAVVARFAIPRALPEALLEGFEWDAAGRRYETLEELQAYAARVAGAVGAMMALLMGVRSAEGLARACDLGVAMQLSNIARDVGEDARMGRLYLPRQWLREAGIEPEQWLANPVFGPALGSVVQRLLVAADALYARVDAGVACLPWSCRPGINAARFLYADIGHEVARRGLDSVSQRATVPGSRKALLLARALVSLNPAAAHRPVPALAATQFLVDAVGPAAAGSTPVPARPSRWNVKQRVLWLIDLFERLERREQMGLQRGR